MGSDHDLSYTCLFLQVHCPVLGYSLYQLETIIFTICNSLYKFRSIRCHNLFYDAPFITKPFIVPVLLRYVYYAWPLFVANVTLCFADSAYISNCSYICFLELHYLLCA